MKETAKGRKGRKDVLHQIEDFVKEEILKNEHREGPLSYIEAFLKDRKVASIAPSTKFLVDRVVKMLPSPTRTIVEYGPAEGVITRHLLERLPADGTLFAIETNERFIQSLGKIRDSRLKVIHGDVQKINELLNPLGIGNVDAIVSGIPFSFLKPIPRHQLMHRTEERLRPGGRFIAYQVTAHLWPLMEYHFEKVDMQFELRNLPPNFIFTGFK